MAFKAPLRCIPIALTFLILSSASLFADTAQADALLQQGRADEAQAALQQVIAAQPDNAQAHQLLCRVYYAQELVDEAIHECELSATKDPSSSTTQMWLGRAYGMKASRANPLVAFSVARKVHYAFEKAVQLDPQNVQAMSDLGQFYVYAPALVGGGLDKAHALANQMLPRFPAQAHRLLAFAAAQEKDPATAEAEFKKAILAAKTPATYIDLSQFYQQQNQPDKAVEALQTAVAADRKKDASLVDAASILTTMNRSPQFAASLLRQYLSSPTRSEDAPAFKVRVQLGDLLQHQGDAAGAHREYATAIILASNYVPARKAMQGS